MPRNSGAGYSELKLNHWPPILLMVSQCSWRQAAAGRQVRGRMPQRASMQTYLEIADEGFFIFRVSSAGRGGRAVRIGAVQVPVLQRLA